METLITQAGRALVGRAIAADAQRLGVPTEVAHTYITTQVADAARFWEELGADPTRMAAEVKVAKAQRQVRAGRAVARALHRPRPPGHGKKPKGACPRCTGTPLC